MKKSNRKFLLGASITAAFLLSSAAQAITVPGTANLFHGGNDFTGAGLGVEHWTLGDPAVLLGQFSGGTVIDIHATGIIDFDINHSYGLSDPDGYYNGYANTAMVLKPLNGGSGFYSGTLIGVWSTSNDPDNITPVGSSSVFVIGKNLSGLVAPTNPGGDSYLFAGIADQGWGDNSDGPFTHDGKTFSGVYDVTVTPVPLPATLWLMGSGLLGLLGYRRFQQRGEADEAGAAAA